MNDIFSKWQERTQNLRTHTISVLLGISLATIGYIIDKVSDASFAFENIYAKWIFAFAVIALIANAFTTMILMLNRLQGFRHTTSIVRTRDKEEKENLEQMRSESLQIDIDTHWLFKLAVWFFSFGEILTIVAFTIQISPKLR